MPLLNWANAPPHHLHPERIGGQHRIHQLAVSRHELMSVEESHRHLKQTVATDRCDGLLDIRHRAPLLLRPLFIGVSMATCCVGWLSISVAAIISRNIQIVPAPVHGQDKRLNDTKALYTLFRSHHMTAGI